LTTIESDVRQERDQHEQTTGNGEPAPIVLDTTATDDSDFEPTIVRGRE